MCGFNGIWRGYYFKGKPIGKVEVEVRVGKLKNGKAASKDEIKGEMIKGGGDKVVDWIWRLCNMAFENGGVSEDWRSVVIVPRTRVKERGLNVRTIEVLAGYVWLEKYIYRDLHR